MTKIIKTIIALSAFLAASYLWSEIVSCPVAQFQWKCTVYDDSGHFLHSDSEICPNPSDPEHEANKLKTGYIREYKNDDEYVGWVCQYFSASAFFDLKPLSDAGVNKPSQIVSAKITFILVENETDGDVPPPTLSHKQGSKFVEVGKLDDLLNGAELDVTNQIRKNVSSKNGQAQFNFDPGNAHYGMPGENYYKLYMAQELANQSIFVSLDVEIGEAQDPVKITKNIKSAEVLEDDDLYFLEVGATGDGVQYQWEIMYPGTKIWEEIEGATSSSLIVDTSLDMSGASYRCRVYNNENSVYSSAAKITIRPKPTLDALLVTQNKLALEFEGDTIHAYADYPIEMKVSATGKKIKYQWYKDGEPIKGATKASYTIKNPTPLNSWGVYFCEVYNADVSLSTAEFFLDIVECPVPASFEAMDISLSGMANGEQQLDLKLMFLNKSTLHMACEQFAVSNASWSFKRTSPTSGKVTLKFKLYDKAGDEPITKNNTLSFSYTGEINFNEDTGKYELAFVDKKYGLFFGSFEPDDILYADIETFATLPIGSTIWVGDKEIRIIDKKNFVLKDGSRGTYTYKSYKNGMGLLKVSFKDGNNKTPSMSRLSAWTTTGATASEPTTGIEAKTSSSRLSTPILK
ncbi:MAG: immunoglobulin domain-containing protein [Opitutales bacterium]|nr:immunoglobulin domain-containing protein [Opitutales bacterium]